jgi:biopolymer transport protein ExbD
MFLRNIRHFDNSGRTAAFNMTPIIDIVFLLIIFFIVACRFIEAENFPVAVPDECEYAQNNSEPGSRIVTLTVMKTEEQVSFAVGSEKVVYEGDGELIDRLCQLIDIQLKDLPAESRIVMLRIDRSIPFAEAQYALAAVAQSTATDIQLAALKEKRSAEQE